MGVGDCWRFCFFQIEHPSIFKGNRTRDEFQSIFFGDSFDPRVEMSLRLSIFFWAAKDNFRFFVVLPFFYHKNGYSIQFQEFAMESNVYPLV